MIKGKRGQVSFEYLLIFSISLIILIVFTMPLINHTMATTFDVSESLDVKDDLSKIALSINGVYGEGQGARQTVSINAVKPFKVDVAGSYLSCNLKLKDNNNKLIKVPCKSNLKSSSIYLDKGMNNVVVEWPVGSENMLIY